MCVCVCVCVLYVRCLVAVLEWVTVTYGAFDILKQTEFFFFFFLKGKKEKKKKMKKKTETK